MSVARWPRVSLVSGPSQAGVRVGDALPLAPDHWLFASSHYWTGTRAAMSVRSARDAFTNGHGWRYSGAAARFEVIDYGGSSSSGARWRPVDSATIELGAGSSLPERWTLALVDDGPAITAVRRFGPHLCVNPTAVDAHGATATSRWIRLDDDGSLGGLDVVEALDGALSFAPVPRQAGAALYWLDADFRALDAEIAAGIVAQMTDHQPSSWVGFDGVVRHFAPGGSSQGARTRLFAELTGAPHPKGERGEADARAALAAVRPATREEIAGVVRALLPEEWARERQLVEECAALPRDGGGA